MTTVNLTAPPPPGVECDCEKDCVHWDRECDCPVSHWHQRFMAADCDGCDGAHVEADFHVYTRAGGFQAIANLVRRRGWSVVDGTYLCPTCKEKQ